MFLLNKCKMRNVICGCAKMAQPCGFRVTNYEKTAEYYEKTAEYYEFLAVYYERKIFFHSLLAYNYER